MAGTRAAILDHEVILGLKLYIEKQQDRRTLWVFDPMELDIGPRPLTSGYYYEEKWPYILFKALAILEFSGTNSQTSYEILYHFSRCKPNLLQETRKSISVRTYLSFSYTSNITLIVTYRKVPIV